MTNLVLFLNSFVSYLLLVLVFVLVICVAVWAGITLRKKKNEKDAAEAADNAEDAGVTK